MSSQNEMTLLRQLIADNRNKEAAERLYQWFEGKSAGRQDAALALLNRISALDSNVLGGLVSQADAELERNRITKALLELTKQLDETGEAEPEKPAESKAWMYGVLAILVAGMIYLSFDKRKSQPPAPDVFKVKVALNGPGGPSEVINTGKIKLLVGAYVSAPQDINSNGEAICDDIPGKYFSDTVQVVPLNMRYKVVSQSAFTAAQSQNIRFTLAPIPDTTVVRGIVYLPGPGNKPAAGATLDFGIGKGSGTTDEKGRFQIPVLAAASTTITLRIDYKGKNRYDRQVTVSANTELPITLNP